MFEFAMHAVIGVWLLERWAGKGRSQTKKVISIF